jgi:hypothetical protein
VKTEKTGSVRVKLPEFLVNDGNWWIRVGEIEGKPNLPIAAPAGINRIVVAALFEQQQESLSFNLAIEVAVTADGITDVYLPVPERVLCELSRLIQA